MRKILCLLLSMFMLLASFSFWGCDVKDDTNANTDTDNTQTNTNTNKPSTRPNKPSNLPSGIPDDDTTSDTTPDTTPEESNPTEPTEYNVVTQVVKENGRAVLKYLGEPFLMLGAQIRLDGYLNEWVLNPSNSSDIPNVIDGYRDTMFNVSQMTDETKGFAKYVKKAKEFGLTCIEVPICWNWIEPQKDQYDFSVVAKALEVCNIYDMKMEMLWYSSNQCGDSFSMLIPDYIFYDNATYPKLASTSQATYNYMYGDRCYIKMDDPNYMERERKAITNLMEFVYNWNKTNGLKYPLITVQVHNEPDGLLRWRAAQSKILSKNGMSHRQIWEMIKTTLNSAGNAFKAAKYKVVTRVNMTVTFGIDPVTVQKERNDDVYEEIQSDCAPKEVYDLEGIDIIGDDPYTGYAEQEGGRDQNSVENIKKIIMRYSRYKDNYAHIAENKGRYQNTPSLILAAVSNGGGYDMYDFATPKMFLDWNTYLCNKNGKFYEMDQGVLNWDLSDKVHSVETSNIVTGLKKGGYLLATEQLDNITAFNIEGDMPTSNYSKTVKAGKKTINFTCTENGLGYLVQTQDAIYVFSTKDAHVTFSGYDNLPLVAYSGEFVNGEFVKDKDSGTDKDKKYYVIGNDFDVKANNLFMIKLRSTN